LEIVKKKKNGHQNVKGVEARIPSKQMKNKRKKIEKKKIDMSQFK